MKYLKIELKNKECQGIYYLADERISDGLISKVMMAIVKNLNYVY